MNYKLNTGAGDNFSTVAEAAKKVASHQDFKHPAVEFEFNGIVCLVDKNTDVSFLYRDYANAWTMEWKTVGPNCVKEYDKPTADELNRRNIIKENKAEEQRKEWEKQEKEERLECERRTKGIEIDIIPDKMDEYKQYVEKNSADGYSRGVIYYSEAWAKLMQVELSKGRTVKECAEETQKPLGYLGITGFMYGCAVNGLAHFWKHGEELRKWHNKEYGVSEDKEGVVNPALLTISV